MNEYFNGWYLKCQSLEESLAVIPAYHVRDGKKFFSIQLITGQGVFYNVFPFEKSSRRAGKFGITIGENIFCEKGIFLKIEQEGLAAKGWLRFGKLSPIRYDIMGPFCRVPFMECRHSVYSMRHRVDGKLLINGREYLFRDGIGYIEGDRGHSFPKRYVWTQCLFGLDSLMLSVAEIPIGPVRFTGVIGVILWQGKEYRLATYLGARVMEIGRDRIVIRQGCYTFTARLLEKRALPLYAPIRGEMTRIIRESLVCRAHYELQKNGGTLFSFESNKASFEYEWTPAVK